MAQASRFLGKHVAVNAPSPHVPSFRRVTVRAESDGGQPTRRVALLSGAASLGALFSHVEHASAAYGEAANIFGKTSDTSGYIPYVGEGYALLLPSKWNPSKEADFTGTVLRWEDNFDPLSHVVVTKTKTSSSSIEGVGSPEKVLETLAFMIGEQVFAGETISEGGFAKDKVSTASLIDMEQKKDKNGRGYYKYQLLVRSADNNEGGRHVLLTAAVSGGNLYVQKVQCGDKRWFKGAERQARTVNDSFTVA